MTRIALDAGHGINTAGKRTPDGEREWSFNNKVLLSCADELNKYKDVQILRLDDPTGKSDTPLVARTNQANRFKADVLVSIHHNANTGRWGSWGGIETYVDNTASRASKDIANIIHPRIVKAMGLSNRGVKTANFHMTRESRMLAILTEGGFMDSTTDISALRSDSKLKAQGVAIAEGLAEYFKLIPKTTVAVPTFPKKEVDEMDLNKSEREELSRIFKHAREKNVFSSATHEKSIVDGTMTISRLFYLQGIIAGAALNNGKRI